MPLLSYILQILLSGVIIIINTAPKPPHKFIRSVFRVDFISFKKKEYLYSSSSPNIEKFKMHLHQYYEFLYFVDGDGTYMVEDTEYSAGPGDLFITRPEELHAIAFRPGSHYARKFVQISPSFLGDVDIDLLKFINTRPLGQFNKIEKKIADRYDFYKYFKSIEEYVVNRVPESDLMIRTYMIQFLVKLNSAFSEIGVSQSLVKRSNPKIERIIEYINENISEDISLDALAETVYINKYYMCHMFKDTVGLSVKEYVNTRRIAEAKKLLSAGGDFTSICFKCGFNDYSTFYKTFKKFTGMSPRKFLK